MRRSKEITILAIVYLIIGMFNIFIGFSDKSNIVFLMIGLICSTLAIGLFKLCNWARIIAIAISIFFIIVYALLVIGTIMNKFQGWGGMGLLFNFPILLLSISVLDVLMRPNVKQQFMS